MTAACVASAVTGGSLAAGETEDAAWIRDTPIHFGADRVALTREYISDHYGLRPADISIVPRAVVVHWTGGPSFKAAFNTFNPARLGGGRRLLEGAGALNVSAHFLVDRDGTVHRLMPERWMARHVIGLNYDALGIENVGGPAHPLTDAQLAANARLLGYLVAKHPTVEYLAGHYEYRGFEGTPLFRERDAKYRTAKADPGPEFMARLRRRVASLRLRPPPGSHGAEKSTRAPGGSAVRILEVRVASRIVAADGVASLPDTRPTHARKGEAVELLAIVRAHAPGAKTKARWYGPPGVATVRLGKKKVGLGSSAELGDGIRLRWSKVEPRMEHLRGEGPVDGVPTYCNAMLGGPDHGRWLGVDGIGYFETVLAVGAGPEAWRRPGDAHPTTAILDDHDGLGTMRYAVDASVDGGATWVESPGAESVDRLGVTAAVHRISFRESDDFVGWLTSYFNVPQVFGSIAPQAEGYVGVDCADVLVGAVRAMGRRHVGYTFVGGLWKVADEIAPRVSIGPEGLSRTDLRWGADVRRGDLVAIGYDVPAGTFGRRSWPHVVALYADASDPDGPHRGGADGRLDPHDLIIHMGHPALEIEPLASQGPALLAFLRWKKK